MPMPGPRTPRAASPAPDVIHRVSSSYSPGRRHGIIWDRGWAAPRAARQWAGWSADGSWPWTVVERLLGDVALLVLVALDREHDEHEGQDAEDQRLDRVEHDLEAEQADRDERDRQRGDDAERDLAAVDVAEESHRQRDRLDELEHELDEPDEQGDAARRDPVLELVEREELAGIAAGSRGA